MLILRIISYTCFGLAGLGTIFALGEGEIMLMSLSVSTAIAGVLMLALDKIVTTLTEIRDTIVGPTQVEGSTDTSIDLPTENHEITKSTPAKSLEEISADIERMKSNL
jgi:hypothetical protein